MAESKVLENVIDALDSQNDETTAYLDRSTGDVTLIDDEIVSLAESDEPLECADWQREIVEVFREIENGSKRYVQLPSKWDVHEWEIMRRFCENVEDDGLRETLLSTIRGRGAFRRFKDDLDRHGLLERWYEFKHGALREQAIAWCEENDVAIT